MDSVHTELKNTNMYHIWLQETLLSLRFVSVFPTLLSRACVERKHRYMLAKSHLFFSVWGSR